MPRGQLRERNQFLRASFPRGLGENISCNNYWAPFFRFFGNDSRGETSTISYQSGRAGRWALGHYRHKRGHKMKNRCRELGKVSLANRLAGCGNMHVGYATLWARRVRKGNGAATNQKSKPPMTAKSSRFDSLVARYYPAVYGVASRLTDDPRKAVLLTHDAFNSTRKQLWSRRDEVALVTILLNAVIRAGLAAA